MNHRYQVTLITLVLLLTTVCSANPNVALVKVLAGRATLNDREYRTGFLVSEGDKLKLPKNSEVVLKILNDGGEKRVVGPTELSITLETLRTNADLKVRGQVRVADCFGNINTTAGISLRSAADALQKEYAEPELKRDDGARDRGRLILFGGDPKRVSSRSSYRVEMKELSSDIAEPVLHQKITQTAVQDGFEFEKLRSGSSYEVIVYKAGNSNVLPRSLVLRLLTEEESTILNRLKKDLRRKYRRTRKPQHLIDLAECYLAFDQPRDALRTLSRLEHLGLGSDFQEALHALRTKTLMPMRM